MDRIHAAPLAFALLMGLAMPAVACRNAQDGKPWRPKEAQPGATVTDVTVPDGSKDFTVGASPVDRVHFCVRMALADPTDQSAGMGLYLWTKSNQNFYLISVTRGKLRVTHRLFGQEFELVPPTDLDTARVGDDRMHEFDVKANETGADVEVDGQPLVGIVARPSVDAKRYGVVFSTGSGKPFTFRLGPVQSFGDSGEAP